MEIINYYTSKSGEPYVEIYYPYAQAKSIYRIINRSSAINESVDDELHYSIKETYNGQDFRITFYDENIHISSVHPYDLQDYHWAKSKDGGLNWNIYLHSPGKLVKSFVDKHGFEYDEYDNILKELYNLDKDIEARIDKW